MADLTALADTLQARGWVVLPKDVQVLAWAQAARRVVLPMVSDPEQQEVWLRHGGTWFAGVDLLPNAPDGSVDGVPFAGTAVELVDHLGLAPSKWHAAQVSVTYPGYPQADQGESPGAIRFRRVRDAAHLDGLLPVGPKRRRMLREPHAFILGIPLTEADPGAAPLVVWDRSHHTVGRALADVLSPMPPEMWSELDMTEAYTQVRKRVFADHARRTLPVRPGETILLHRHMLHGIAPWDNGASSEPEGRMIAYFRPCFPTLSDWITVP